MKVKSFIYTKADGSKSNRVVAAISEPSQNMFGIDITELDPVVQGQFAAELQMVLDKRKDDIEHLMGRYDIKYNYRTFKASGMSEVVTD